LQNCHEDPVCQLTPQGQFREGSMSRTKSDVVPMIFWVAVFVLGLVTSMTAPVKVQAHKGVQIARSSAQDPNSPTQSLKQRTRPQAASTQIRPQ
jgi:hypothetical protein